MDIMLSQSDKENVYTGICADFNGRNENNRLYDKDDYLKHLPYLNELIKDNKLYGEIDHPHRYEVDEDKISHQIIALWYDEEANQVMIAIKLLDTDEGKRAKAKALENGNQINISSRASGYMDEELNVELERIYTYDIVDVPGFKNATLKPLNENRNNGNNSSIYLLVINENKIVHNMDDNNKSTNIDDLINENRLLRSTVNSLLEKANESDRKLNAVVAYLSMINEDSNHHKNYTNSIAKYVNKLTDHVDKNSEFTNKLADHVDESNRYVNKLTDHVDKNSEFTNKLADYADYLGINLNKSMSFINENSEFTNKLADYADYLGINLNKSINVMDENSDFTNKLADYSNYMNENLNNVISKLDENSDFTNKLADAYDNTADFINNKVGAGKIKPKKKKTEKEKSMELVEKVKSRQNDKQLQILVSKYPFVKSLNESYLTKFKLLNSNKKRIISDFINENNDVTVSSLMGKIDEINNVTTLEEQFESRIPQYIFPIWESLSTTDKHNIVSQYNSRKIESNEDNKRFWESIDLRKYKNSKIVNENHGGGEYNMSGYSMDDVDKLLKF